MRGTDPCCLARSERTLLATCLVPIRPRSSESCRCDRYDAHFGLALFRGLRQCSGRLTMHCRRRPRRSEQLLNSPECTSRCGAARASEKKVRISRYKVWMRSVLVHRWAALLLGFATYPRWYVSHGFHKCIREIRLQGGWLKFVPICLLTMFCAFAQHGFAQSGMNSVPDANPGRPTDSTPAS